jgi:hypothetical protein
MDDGLPSPHARNLPSPRGPAVGQFSSDFLPAFWWKRRGKASWFLQPFVARFLLELRGERDRGPRRRRGGDGMKTRGRRVPGLCFACVAWRARVPSRNRSIGSGRFGSGRVAGIRKDIPCSRWVSCSCTLILKIY